MATLLSDVFVPRVFSSYLNEAVTRQSALVASGAIARSAVLDTYTAGAGRVTDLPNFSEFAYTAPDIATDNTTLGPVNKVTTGVQIGQKDFLSKAWGTSALTNSVSGEDILGHVVNNVVAPYWAQALQDYTLAKLGGVILDNIANDAGDMVSNVANDAVGAPAAAQLFNIDTFIDARQTMGDAANKLSIIIMHSQVYSNLLKAEPTNTSPRSATQPFNTYMGHIVLIDDGMPVVQGTNRRTFTSYLLGQGAILLGEAEPEFGSVEIKRDADQGFNYGSEKLITRKKMILHPQGFASSATVAANAASPTLAAYNTATAWNRVFNRKNVPIVAFRTNG